MLAVCSWPPQSVYNKMDAGEKSPLEVLLTCPVCRDIFTDPRQLPCGHSICMVCLNSLVQHSTEIPFRCPDCRCYFGKIVEVQKSYALASIVEDYRESKKAKAKQTQSVGCDCCPERKQPAVKTCLKCEVSLCKEHVRDHVELPVFTCHPLVSPLADLPDRKCPRHDDEVLRYYCSASRRYVCNVCDLETKRMNLATEASGVLARRLTDYMDQRFQLLEGKMNESKDSIKKLQDDFTNEKQKVKPQDSSLNSVTVVVLCLWFIVLYYACNFAVENQMLTDKVSMQQRRLHEIYSNIAEFLVEPERDSGDVVQEALEVPLTLDVDTASPFLRVSDDLQSAERVLGELDYPSLASRFEAPQVLSSQCFSSGTHLWLVEAHGHWEISVSYKSIQRKGEDDSAFGVNPQSWSLVRNHVGQLSAYHRKTSTNLSRTLKSNSIAVKVHFEKGTIAFSEVGANSFLTKLHEFQTELTEPVCLGLGLHSVYPPSRASIIRAIKS